MSGLQIFYGGGFLSTHTHIIMVSPETDILKIVSTIIQRRFECFEAFFLLSYFF